MVNPLETKESCQTDGSPQRSSQAEPGRAASHLAAPSASRYRWVICGLLFCATTVNYVDRQVFGVLGPRLTEQLNWSETDFSLIVWAFTLAYAIGYSAAGRMMDRIGVRRGFTLIVAVWSAAAMAHGLITCIPEDAVLTLPLPSWLARALAVLYEASGGWIGSTKATVTLLMTVLGFMAARFCLGLAEGGNFPGAIKTVGEWHPKKERAFSTGLFNSGSNVGIIVAVYAGKWIVEDMQWGWPAAFYLTGSLGFLLVVFWLWMYRSPDRHPRVSAEELAYIRSDPPDPPAHIPWLTLLRYRQTWAYTLGMFFTSPIWWFYLYWLPKFLKNNHDIDLKDVFWPLLVVYLVADAGSIAGGWFSSWLIQRGSTVNVARKGAFLACSLCVLPVAAVARLNNLWLVIGLVALAAAAHTGFAANLYTIVSDTVPRKAVSSVVGIGGTAACLGMLLLSLLIGHILDRTYELYGQKDYLVPFLIAASAYLAATGIIHLLLPRLKPMEFPDQEAQAG